MKLIDVDRAEMELTNPDRDICDQEIPSEQLSVVHGKWDVNFDGDNIVYCNQCYIPQDMKTPCCLHCGAIMDEDDKQ